MLLEAKLKREKQIKAIVVDDAAFMRRQLVEIISGSKEIDVVGVARHGKEALEAIEVLNPDVITLDVDMPVMDGITTIKHIMVKSPVPVVMVSGLSDQGSITFDALRLGAIDFFPKPSGTISEDLSKNSQELIQSLKIAAKANLKAVKRALKGKNVKKGEIGTPSHIDGLLLIFSGHGSISSFIRFISATVPLANMAMVSIHDLPHKILSGFSKELSSICNSSFCEHGEMALKGGQLILLSENNIPRIKRKKDGLYLSFKKNGSGLKDIFPMLFSEFGAGLNIVVLGGRVPEDTSFFEMAKDAKAKIIALSPEICPCGEISRFLEEKGLATIVSNERVLWELVKGISRELKLRRIGQKQEREH